MSIRCTSNFCTISGKTWLKMSNSKNEWWKWNEVYFSNVTLSANAVYLGKFGLSLIVSEL